MIQHYKFSIENQDHKAVPSFLAYRLYAALLEQMPEEIGTRAHEQGYSGISQYLAFDRENQKSIWHISLLGDEEAAWGQAVLPMMQSIALHEMPLSVQLLEAGTAMSAESLLAQAARLDDVSKIKLTFHTVTSFKSQGAYQIFPSTELILHSLMQKWNACFPDMLLEDEDAFQMLCQGVQIREYRLKSARYKLKKTSIPGFVGELELAARLADPMMEIWKLLLTFAPFCGIGIKTALGMGGVEFDT